MLARLHIQRPVCTAVLVAYGLLATGTLHGWHDLCSAECHEVAHVGDVLDRGHHDDTHGSSHSSDCPICHQLNVASAAAPHFATFVVLDSDDQFLGHRRDGLLASAQAGCMNAAPRAPPHLI